MSNEYRFLHWVFKIGPLKNALSFYQGVLDMLILRHEEFNAGCEAECNGPYARPWSKTMIGWGKEQTNFVFELTYNYGIKKYAHGDDLRYIAISHPEAVDKAKQAGLDVEALASGQSVMTDPDGYKWLVTPSPSRAVNYVSVNVSSIDKSKQYYVDTLGMQVFNQQVHSNGDLSIRVGYHSNQTQLELYQRKERQGMPINHEAAFGRIAIATKSGPKPIFERITAAGYKVQHAPVSLETPGKATVEVVIIQDVDDYEICYVGQEAFDQLCEYIPGKTDIIDWDARAEFGGL